MFEMTVSVRLTVEQIARAGRYVLMLLVMLLT